MKIIQRYVLKGHVGPFFLGLALFSFVLFLGRLDDVAKTIAKAGWQGMHLATYVPVFSLQYTVPMGILVASLITFGRLTADNELTALRASGISPLWLIFPCLGTGLILSLFSLQLSDRVVPAARYRFGILFRQVSEGTPEIIFREGVYIEDFSGYTIWVDSVKGKNLKGIRIWQHPEGRQEWPLALQAATGDMFKAPEGGKISLKLKDVTWERIWLEEGEINTRRVESEEYELSLEFSEASGVSRSPAEMNFAQLRAKLREYNRKKIVAPVTDIKSELQERIALSFACLTFVLVGTPLGIRAKRGSRGVALGISFGLIILYYCLLVVARMLAARTGIPVALALWLPNIFLAGAGVYLLTKIAGVPS